MNVIFTILWYLYIILQIFLASFLIQPFLVLLVYSIVKLFKGKQATADQPPAKNYRFGIIITSHQETTFLPPIIDSLQKQVYPHFTAYVVADDCDISNLNYDDPRINILKPPVAFHSKTKSIKYAIEHFKEEDEILVIFDPDNLAHPRFLEVLNHWYNKGFKVVQGNLQSKNSEGTYAQMDDIGTLFNTFIDRDSRTLLGLSANIWGCGISVEKQLYLKIAYDGRSQSGGFDKHMQAEMAKHVRRIGYATDAILFDEKVDDGSNLEKQRNRWIRAYFRFFAEAFGLFLVGIGRLNFNLTYFGYNLVRPPYFLQFLTAFFFIALNLFISPWLSVAWIIALVLFVVSFFLIVMTQASNQSTSKGIWYMPLFFYHQVQALLKLKKSKRVFLQTEHSKVLYIDDILKHDPIH